MGIASDITRLQGAKTDVAAAIEAKGVTVPEGTKMDGFAALIGDIPVGSISWDTVNELNRLTEATVLDPDRIVHSAFRANPHLVTVHIPSTITDIGDSAFQGCTGLTMSSFTFPDSYTIGNNSFNGCTGLSGKLKLNGLTYLNGNAFTTCTGLTKVWIPSTCLTINNSLTKSWAPFYGCSSTMVIYCEPASKPDGWDNYWAARTLTYYFTVNWGVSEAAFDAL